MTLFPSFYSMYMEPCFKTRSNQECNEEFSRRSGAEEAQAREEPLLVNEITLKGFARLLPH